MKKIGIIGGTFNPIHYGHLLLGEQAIEICQLDQVMFLPSGTSYMKDYQHILPGEIRLKMVELAIKGNPHFFASDMEVKRTGYSYTADTLLELHQMYPEYSLSFIIGADNLFSIETWKDPDIIFQNCTLIAAFRNNHKEEELISKKLELEQKYGAHIILLPERRVDISSSEIRERIKNDKSVSYLLPGNVLEFIKDNHFYE